MKKTILLLALLVAALSARADVTINATNFPDANFRAYLLSEYPKGYITSAELNSRTELHVDYENISDLTGVGYFSNLTWLSCSYNNLTSLSTLPSTLKNLYCNDNQLTTIGIRSCWSTLQVLDCKRNNFSTLSFYDMPALRQLDFSYCSELTDVYCHNNPQLADLRADGCTTLNNLNCLKNDLSTLMVDGCTALETLNCAFNKLYGISFLNTCTSLTFLDCSNNRITGLDNIPGSLQLFACQNNQLTHLPALPSGLNDMFDCGHNQLTALPALPNGIKELYCNDNQLTALPTLPDNIEVVDCSNNNIAGDIVANSRYRLCNLDVSNNPALTLLNVGNDVNLSDFDIRGCTGLKTLSMSNLPRYNFSYLTLPSALESFTCSSNGLTALPALSESLKELYCDNNQLTALPTLPATIETVVAGKNRFTTLKINEMTNLKSLNVGNNPLLTELNCSYNALSALDISGCTALKTLLCNNNQLAALNVQGLAALEKVACGANQLTSLSLQGCNALSFVNCCHNQIKDSEMTAMIGSLRAMPAGTQGTLQVLASADEGNTITNAQVRAARNKGWIPYKWRLRDFYEITVEDEVPGDLDGSGTVDVDDLNIIINMMLDKTDKSDAADLNGDGNVDVDDLNAIINIILGKD